MDWRRFFNPKTTPTPAQTPQKTSGIPMWDQAMSATKGATDAFSGVTNQVNATLKMVGSSGIQGVAGYAIGFSHGFGLGRSSNQFQSRLTEPMTKMIGLIPGLPFGRGALPGPAPSKSDQSNVPTDQISAERMIQMATKSEDQVSAGSIMQHAPKAVDQFSQGSMMQLATKSDSQKEKILSNFPQNPSLKGEGGGLDEAVGLMQPENKILQTVMKQRQIIDALVEENEKLCQILQMKDLKTPSNKLQAISSDSNIQTFPSSEVQDKISSNSRPPGDVDGTLPISKGENDGMAISEEENNSKKVAK